VDTNTYLQANIADTVQKLLHLKRLAKSYDPYSETLEDDLASFITDLTYTYTTPPYRIPHATHYLFRLVISPIRRWAGLMGSPMECWPT
jgi:hypothetical protein